MNDFTGVSVHRDACGYVWCCYRPGCLARGPDGAPSFVAANVARTAHAEAHARTDQAARQARWAASLARRVRQLELGL